MRTVVKISQNLIKVDKKYPLIYFTEAKKKKKKSIADKVRADVTISKRRKTTEVDANELGKSPFIKFYTICNKCLCQQYLKNGIKIFIPIVVQTGILLVIEEGLKLVINPLTTTTKFKNK